MSETTLNTMTQGLEDIRQSPRDSGHVKMIVCRPEKNKRQVLQEVQINKQQGLVGDCWAEQARQKALDGPIHTENQLTLMNARAIALIAPDRSDWPLAGDQFFLDLDLSPVNLPPGSRLQLGSAIIEITDEPHLGCRKFSDRFGKDAVRFVNSDDGKAVNARGVNARVIQDGRVVQGDPVAKIKVMS